MSTPDIVAFHQALTAHYYEHGRHTMLWRQPEKDGRFDPYKILVSEMMLQQTQVDRVTPKYQEFLDKFPAITHLANAPLSDVLKVWNGLGYNRRAKYIWEAAKMVQQEYDGIFPASMPELKRLPGIGPNTAGALMAYAYNAPVIFVETNIRTVIIHHFYKDRKDVPDTSIRDVLEQVLPTEGDSDRMKIQGALLGPRQFYWAMMDYGSYLKKSVGNASRASKHYKKQSAFHGSIRQVRGQVIRELAKAPLSREKLAALIADPRLEEVITALAREGMVVDRGATIRLR